MFNLFHSVLASFIVTIAVLSSTRKYTVGAGTKRDERLQVFLVNANKIAAKSGKRGPSPAILVSSDLILLTQFCY